MLSLHRWTLYYFPFEVHIFVLVCYLSTGIYCKFILFIDCQKNKPLPFVCYLFTGSYCTFAVDCSKNKPLHCMLSHHRSLRFKELSHSLYHYLCFYCTVFRISSIINSLNPVPFFLLDPARKSKSKVILIKAPVDTAFGTLLVVSAVSPFALTGHSWELRVTASLERFLPSGRIRMRSLQWHLKDCLSSMVDSPADQIPVAGVHRGCLVVAPGGQVAVWGSSLGPSPIPVIVYRRVSVGLESAPVGSDGSGVWSEEESAEHINVLEMKAVALAAFLPQLLGLSFVLMSTYASVGAYLWHQGGTVSRALCLMASEITMWTEWLSFRLSARYIPGRKNFMTDQVLPMEWSLPPKVFEGICSVFGRPHLDLFDTQANTKLPLYVSLVPNPLAWK